MNLMANFEALRMIRDADRISRYNHQERLETGNNVRRLREDIGAVMIEDKCGAPAARRILTKRIGGVVNLRSYLLTLAAGEQYDEDHPGEAQ